MGQRGDRKGSGIDRKGSGIRLLIRRLFTWSVWFVLPLILMLCVLGSSMYRAQANSLRIQGRAIELTWKLRLLDGRLTLLLERERERERERRRAQFL